MDCVCEASGWLRLSNVKRRALSGNKTGPARAIVILGDYQNSKIPSQVNRNGVNGQFINLLLKLIHLMLSLKSANNMRDPLSGNHLSFLPSALRDFGEARSEKVV